MGLGLGVLGGQELGWVWWVGAFGGHGWEWGWCVGGGGEGVWGEGRSRGWFSVAGSAKRC